MNNNAGSRAPLAINLALGGILIIVGVFFLLAELLGIRLGRFLWPFFVIVPGAFLFALGLTIQDREGSEVLAIIGGLVTMTGILLFYQNFTGHWASWAYAWALVAPTSIGLALMAYGAVKGLTDKVREGADLAKVGLAIFAIAAVFFELVIGISGFGLGRYGWPLLLIGAGVLWLLSAFWPRRSRR
jgi:hypothetical protein